MTDDESLWADLQAYVRRTDPVPGQLRESLYATLSWRDPDVQLLALVADSAAEPAAAVRGPAAGARLLTFAAGTLTLEVEVDVDGAGLRLVGQVVPPTSVRLRVEHPGGVVVVDTDDVGQFAATGIRHGPVRLRCDLVEAGVPRRVATEWVLI